MYTIAHLIVDSLPTCKYRIVLWSSRPNKIIWMIHILMFDARYRYLSNIQWYPMANVVLFPICYCAEKWAKNSWRWDETLALLNFTSHETQWRTFRKRFPIPFFLREIWVVKYVTIDRPCCLSWLWPLRYRYPPKPTVTHSITFLNLKLKNQNLPDIRMCDDIYCRHVSWKIGDLHFLIDR